MHPDAAAYLERIGAIAPPPPDLDTLRELQIRHLRTVPFENLSIHLGEDIVLEDAAVVDKIVRRRRGGFCYELNGAFAWLLRRLGFDVTLLAARVVGTGGAGPLFDHLTLRVDLDEPWLVDVGFGRFMDFPIRLDSRDEQIDPAGRYRVAEVEHGDLVVHENDVPRIRAETRPRQLADFVPTCWYQRTSPLSHFTASPTCSRRTETGRITLSGRTLARTVGSEKRETALGSDAEVLAAYREHFGIELDRLPRDPRESA
jgi:N-hydroxyarylamine O-acetyltransferase